MQYFFQWPLVSSPQPELVSSSLGRRMEFCFPVMIFEVWMTVKNQCPLSIQLSTAIYNTSRTPPCSRSLLSAMQTILSGSEKGMSGGEQSIPPVAIMNLVMAFSPTNAPAILQVIVNNVLLRHAKPMFFILFGWPPDFLQFCPWTCPSIVSRPPAPPGELIWC